MLVLSILPVASGENVHAGWKSSFTVAALNYSEVPVQDLVDKLEKEPVIYVQLVIESPGVVLESPPLELRLKIFSHLDFKSLSALSHAFIACVL